MFRSTAVSSLLVLLWVGAACAFDPWELPVKTISFGPITVGNGLCSSDQSFCTDDADCLVGTCVGQEDAVLAAEMDFTGLSDVPHDIAVIWDIGIIGQTGTGRRQLACCAASNETCNPISATADFPMIRDYALPADLGSPHGSAYFSGEYSRLRVRLYCKTDNATKDITFGGQMTAIASRTSNGRARIPAAYTFQPDNYIDTPADDAPGVYHAVGDFGMNFSVELDQTVVSSRRLGGTWLFVDTGLFAPAESGARKAEVRASYCSCAAPPCTGLTDLRCSEDQKTICTSDPDCSGTCDDQCTSDTAIAQTGYATLNSADDYEPAPISVVLNLTAGDYYVTLDKRSDNNDQVAAAYYTAWAWPMGDGDKMARWQISGELGSPSTPVTLPASTWTQIEATNTFWHPSLSNWSWVFSVGTTVVSPNAGSGARTQALEMRIPTLSSITYFYRNSYIDTGSTTAGYRPELVAGAAFVDFDGFLGVVHGYDLAGLDNDKENKAERSSLVTIVTDLESGFYPTETPTTTPSGAPTATPTHTPTPTRTPVTPRYRCPVTGCPVALEGDDQTTGGTFLSEVVTRLPDAVFIRQDQVADTYSAETARRRELDDNSASVELKTPAAATPTATVVAMRFIMVPGSKQDIDANIGSDVHGYCHNPGQADHGDPCRIGVAAGHFFNPTPSNEPDTNQRCVDGPDFRTPCSGGSPCATPAACRANVYSTAADIYKKVQGCGGLCEVQHPWWATRRNVKRQVIEALDRGEIPVLVFEVEPVAPAAVTNTPTPTAATFTPTPTQTPTATATMAVGGVLYLTTGTDNDDTFPAATFYGDWDADNDVSYDIEASPDAATSSVIIVESNPEPQWDMAVVKLTSPLLNGAQTIDGRMRLRIPIGESSATSNAFLKVYASVITSINTIRCILVDDVVEATELYDCGGTCTSSTVKGFVSSDLVVTPCAAEDDDRIMLEVGGHLVNNTAPNHIVIVLGGDGSIITDGQVFNAGGNHPGVVEFEHFPEFGTGSTPTPTATHTSTASYTPSITPTWTNYQRYHSYFRQLRLWGRGYVNRYQSDDYPEGLPFIDIRRGLGHLYGSDRWFECFDEFGNKTADCQEKEAQLVQWCWEGADVHIPAVPAGSPTPTPIGPPLVAAQPWLFNEGVMRCGNRIPPSEDYIAPPTATHTPTKTFTPTPSATPLATSTPSPVPKVDAGCNDGGTNANTCVKSGAQMRRCQAEWADCLQRQAQPSSPYAYEGTVCETSRGTNADCQIHMPAEVTDALICPNETTCTRNLCRVGKHAAEQKFLLGACNLIHWEYTCLWIQKNGGLFDPSICNHQWDLDEAAGSPYSYIPPPDDNALTHEVERGWSTWLDPYSLYCEDYAADMLSFFRTYSHPINGQIDDNCAWAIANTCAFILGDDILADGKTTSGPYGIIEVKYWSSDMVTFCQTPSGLGAPEVGTEQITKLAWETVCGNAARAQLPLRNGCQQASDVPELGWPKATLPTYTPTGTLPTYTPTPTSTATATNTATLTPTP